MSTKATVEQAGTASVKHTLARPKHTGSIIAANGFERQRDMVTLSLLK